MMVRSYLAPSVIHGIGCFAAQAIPRGTWVWKLDRDYDLVLSADEFEWCPKSLRDFAYLNFRTGEWILCADNAKFWNHQSSPNTLEVYTDGYGYDVAAYDIAAGEEITTNYAGFDGDWARKLSRRL